MKTFYFICNYFITLLTTLAFHTQVPELHLKPVSIKRDKRPYNLIIRDTDQVK